ncbi:hypothetical protein Hanom_Chr05g00469081 [Helianthus anomalus]
MTTCTICLFFPPLTIHPRVFISQISFTRSPPSILHIDSRFLIKPDIKFCLIVT